MGILLLPQRFGHDLSSSDTVVTSVEKLCLEAPVSLICCFFVEGLLSWSQRSTHLILCMRWQLETVRMVHSNYWGCLLTNKTQRIREERFTLKKKVKKTPMVCKFNLNCLSLLPPSIEQKSNVQWYCTFRCSSILSWCVTSF